MTFFFRFPGILIGVCLFLYLSLSLTESCLVNHLWCLESKQLCVFCVVPQSWFFHGFCALTTTIPCSVRERRVPNSVIKMGTFSVLLCTGWGLWECAETKNERKYRAGKYFWGVTFLNFFFKVFFYYFRSTYILWTCQMIYHPLSEAVPDAVLLHLIFMSLIPRF